MVSGITDTALEREVAVLADLSRSALVARWRTLHRADPPKGISRRLLVRAIGYEMQVKRYGGLKPTTDRRLRMIIEGTTAGDLGGRKTVPKFRPDLTNPPASG